MIAASPGKGLGLFTAAAISRGAFVCEYAGEVIGPAEAEARSRSSGSSTNYILHVNESYSGGRRQEQFIVDPVRTVDSKNLDVINRILRTPTTLSMVYNFIRNTVKLRLVFFSMFCLFSYSKISKRLQGVAYKLLLI